MTGQELITRFFVSQNGKDKVIISYPQPGSSGRSVYWRESGYALTREAKFPTTTAAISRAMSRMRTLWAKGYRPTGPDGQPPVASSTVDERPRVLWFAERRTDGSSVLTLDVFTSAPEQFVEGAVPDWLDATRYAATTAPRRITGIEMLPPKKWDAPADFRVRLELTGPVDARGNPSAADTVARLSALVVGTANPDWAAIWSDLSAAGSGIPPTGVRAAFQQIQRNYRDSVSEAERVRRIAERAAAIAAADAARTERTEAAVRSEVERIRTERDFGSAKRRIDLGE